MFSLAVSSMSKPAPSSISGAIVPFTSQVPLEGSSTPAMILSMVDLPEPLVPTRPKASPRFTSNEMSSRALNSLKATSPRAKAIKYSFSELNCSEAILKISETPFTATTVSASSEGSDGRIKSSSPATTTQAVTV